MLKRMVVSLITGIFQLMSTELAIRLLRAVLVEAQKMVEETETKTDDRLLLPLIDMGNNVLDLAERGLNDD